MSYTRFKNNKFKLLREKAEDLLANNVVANSKQYFESEFLKISHELEVQQLELEIQNEELKHALASASWSEENYKNLFYNTGTGNVIIDRNGIYLMINYVASQTYNKDPEEIIGKSMFDFLPADTAQHYLDFNKSLLASGGRREYEDSFLIDGKKKTFLIVDQCLKDENGINYAVQSSSIDISVRKNAEEELRFVKGQLNSVIESTGDHIAVLDTKYRFLLFNSAYQNEFKRIFGMDIKVGDSLLHALKDYPDDLYNAKKHWKSAFEGEDFIITLQFGDYELVRNWYEVHYSPIRDADGNVISAVQIVRNVTERIKAERTLIQSEEKFYKTFQSSPVAMSISRINDGCFMGVNSEFLRILERTRDEVVGKKVSDINPWVQPEVRNSIIERILKFGPIRNEESDLLTKSGKIRQMLISADIVLIDDEQCLLVSSQDIGRIKKMEQTIIEDEKKWRTLFEILPVGISLLDKKGKIIDFNQELADFLEISRNKISRAEYPNRKYIHPDGKEFLKEEFPSYIAVQNQMIIKDTEIGVVKEDGQLLWVQVSAAPLNIADISCVLVTKNITDRKINEEALKLSEQTLRSYFYHAPIGIFLANDKGRYIDVNPYACKMTGYSSEELLSMNLIDLLEDEYKDITRNKFKKLADIGYSSSELSFVRKDRSIGFWSVDSVRITPEKYLGFAVDITERTKAKLELLESKASLDEAQEIAKVGDWEFDVINKKMIWSKNLYRIFGYTPCDIEPSIELYNRHVHPDDLHINIIDFEFLEKTKASASHDLRIYLSDGSIKWLRNKILPVFRDNILVKFRGICMDITNYKHIENDLMESAQFNSQIINSAREGVIVYDLDLKYKVWNPFMEELTGYPASNVLGKNPLEVFPFLKEQGIIDGVEKALRGEITEGLEIQRSVKDGWTSDNISPLYNIKGEIIGAISTVSDITNIKKAEIALANEKQRLSSIIKGTNVGTWEWNVQTGETVFNSIWAEILGYTLDELSPVSIDTWRRLIHPDDLIKSKDILEKHFKGELGYYECEARMKHKNGNWVWILDRGIVHKWNNIGKPLLMSGTHQDITKRKLLEENLEVMVKERTSKLTEANIALNQEIANKIKAEEERNALLNELDNHRIMSFRSERLRALGEMAAGIAHELNQPLTGVRGLTEHILISIEKGWKIDDEELKRKLNLIISQADRMTHVIDHVRTFAKKSVQEETFIVNINDIIESAFDLISAQIYAHVMHIDKHISKEMLLAKINPYSFEEVLINLLSNARQAIDEKIKKSRSKFVPKIILTSKLIREDNEILIEIEDNGIGIPKNEIDRVFEPFFTTKHTDDGTGLGLAITKNIIDQLNGTINISSIPTKCTKVTIKLPLYIAKEIQ
jgi:PAS domain S-box-containing protein